MRHTSLQPELGAPLYALSETDLSRRKFLQSAAAASVTAITIPITGIAQSVQAEEVSRTTRQAPVEKILRRYGSEFGPLNNIR